MAADQRRARDLRVGLTQDGRPEVVTTFGDEPGEDVLSCSDIVKRNVLAVLEGEGVKQADLAKLLRWSRAQLSKVLTSDRPLRLDELVQFAWALSVAPASLMTPWDAETALRVELHGGTQWMELAPAEAFNWLAGVMPPPSAQVDQHRYVRLMPPGVQKRPEVLQALREAHGVRITDRGVEYVAQDGTVLLRSSGKGWL